MPSPSTNEPSYREFQVLVALGAEQLSQADLVRKLADKMGMGDVPVYVERLRQKGLVSVVGTARRHRAPPSRVIAATPRGHEARVALQRKGSR